MSKIHRQHSDEFGSSSKRVELRAHTLLCLQGFRGEGYSRGFVDNLAAIHDGLRLDPETWVVVTDAPDAVCGACPHRAGLGCTLNGAESEADMRRQDQHVLTLLDLQSGNRVRWREILERIRRAVGPDDLPGICGTCRWLPLGYCREGLQRLRRADADLLKPGTTSRHTDP